MHDWRKTGRRVLAHAEMTEKSFMTVEEVAAELRVSKSKAYQIVRELNRQTHPLLPQPKGHDTETVRRNPRLSRKDL